MLKYLRGFAQVWRDMSESMPQTFQGQYRGGHPECSKLGSASITLEQSGVTVEVGTFGKTRFTIPWLSVTNVEVATRTKQKGGALAELGSNLSAAAAITSPNPLDRVRHATMTGWWQRQQGAEQIDILVIGYRDNSGFETDILFSDLNTEKVRAAVIAARGRYLPAPGQK